MWETYSKDRKFDRPGLSNCPATCIQQPGQFDLERIQVFGHRKVDKFVVHRVITVNDAVAQINGQFQTGHSSISAGSNFASREQASPRISS